MLAELFFFIIIIVYVFMVIGLELFAIHSNASEENYYQQYGCGIVSLFNFSNYNVQLLLSLHSTLVIITFNFSYL